MLPFTRKEMRFGVLGMDKRLSCVPWRMFAQGDEIYLGNYTTLALKGRFSIHRSGKWYATIGRFQQRLATGLTIEPNTWLHVLELSFFVDGQLPPDQVARFAGKRIALVQIPPDAKLVVNLWLGSKNSKAPPHIPTRMRGQLLWRYTLRSSGTVAATMRVLRRTPDDEATHHLRKTIGRR